MSNASAASDGSSRPFPRPAWSVELLALHDLLKPIEGVRAVGVGPAREVIVSFDSKANLERGRTQVARALGDRERRLEVKPSIWAKGNEIS